MNNYDICSKKVKTPSIDTNMEKNDLERLDQKYALNSYVTSSLNKLMNGSDLSITVKKENSPDQIVEFKRELNLQNTEENHDNMCFERETRFFSIKKSPNVSPSSVITVLNYKKTSNDNFIYLCHICRQSSEDLHQFALHMSTHYECSNHECSVCDQTFPTTAFWAKHLEYHQQRVNSNYQIYSHIVKPTINITSNSTDILLTSSECKKEWLCDICKEKFTEHCHFTYHLESHHIENPIFSEKQIANISNFHDGADCINGKKMKLSAEVTINSSSVNVDGIMNNLVDEMSNGALTNTVATHSNHKSCNTNQIKSHNFFINEKVQHFINENLSTIKTEVKEEHTFEENNGNSELWNYSTAEVNISNLNNSNDFPFPCDVCEERYSSPFQLIAHRKWSHQGIEPYLCKICYKSYTAKFLWNRHLKSHLPKMNCVSEEKTNISKLDTSLLITKSVQHQNQCNCEYCKKGNSLLPLGEKYTKKNQECYNNFKNSTSNKSLERKKKSKYMYYECFICEETYSSIGDVKKHILLIHKLTHATGLDTNLSTNDIEQKTKSYTETNQQNSKLSIPNKNHMISMYIRYKCKACGKSYTRPESLYRHRKYEHNTENLMFICSICNKVLKYKFDMVKHLKNHSKLSSKNKSVVDKEINRDIKSEENCDIVQYICKICKMEFTDNITLLNHTKEHTLNMYECKDCSHLFETNFALGVHILSEHNISVTPKTE